MKTEVQIAMLVSDIIRQMSGTSSWRTYVSTSRVQFIRVSHMHKRKQVQLISRNREKELNPRHVYIKELEYMGMSIVDETHDGFILVKLIFEDSGQSIYTRNVLFVRSLKFVKEFEGSTAATQWVATLTGCRSACVSHIGYNILGKNIALCDGMHLADGDWFIDSLGDLIQEIV